MQWTGNVGRTFGHVLLALGIIAVVLGIVGLVFGGLVLRDAASDPRMRDEDVGEVVEGLILGGTAAVGLGTLSIVAALVALGAARAIRERAQRRKASGEAAAGPPARTA
jgi:hypothetical protein